MASNCITFSSSICIWTFSWCWERKGVRIQAILISWRKAGGNVDVALNNVSLFNLNVVVRDGRISGLICGVFCIVQMY